MAGRALPSPPDSAKKKLGRNYANGIQAWQTISRNLRWRHKNDGIKANIGVSYVLAITIQHLTNRRYSGPQSVNFPAFRGTVKSSLSTIAVTLFQSMILHFLEFCKVALFGMLPHRYVLRFASE